MPEPAFHPSRPESSSAAADARESSTPASPDTPCRVGTIDVGTNSIRLLVVEARPGDRYRLLDDEKVVVRLGGGLGHTSRLADDRMEEAARVISHMRTIAEGYGVVTVRAVATSAVREASNRETFVAMVRETAGLEIEVISGDEEARLAWLSVNHAFDLREGGAAVIDIGGGSTEIVLSAGGVIDQVDSIPIGAVRLTERIGDEEGNAPIRLAKMRKEVRRTLKRHSRKPSLLPSVVIGTGGTFTTLAEIDMLHGAPSEAPAESPASMRGYEIPLASLRHHIERLNAMTPSQRAAVPGLSPDRADIIVAGLAIAERAMMRLGAKSLLVHDRGIRDGLLLRIVDELFPDATAAAGQPLDREAAVRTFAEKCDYERDHSEHVTELATQIFDQIIAVMPELPEPVRDDNSRELLRAASLLHDVGYYINYTRHHKHSYHLIIHSELVGFSHRELEVVANVARYHRRAHPKKSHREYQRLAPDDRRVVRTLAAILRIADGLDRAHSTNVRRVQLELDRRTCWFNVEAERSPDVDLWGAARKSQLFAKVFGMEPRFGTDGDR